MIALAALALTAQLPNTPEPQRTIIALAFAPSRLTGAFFGGDVEILYLGDDYAWPVYSIALWRVCEPRGPACKPTMRARMVRAPNATAVERPRWAGEAIVGAVDKAGARTAEQVAAVLDTLGLQWSQTDLATCPAAREVLATLPDISWVPPGIGEVDPRNPPVPPFGHSDTVMVSVGARPTRHSTFRGPIADDMPSGWAVRLAAALEPCWRPASAPPPWRRPLTPPRRPAPASPPPP